MFGRKEEWSVDWSICSNCGWRNNPNDNTGTGCVLGSKKRPDSCGSYVQDIMLADHLKRLLFSQEEN